MQEKRINVTKSSMPPFEEYCKEIEELWESRWLSNRGSKSVEFEEMIKDYLGVEETYLFANGHVAMEVALNSLYLEGEVITTPFTHVSTTHAIVRNGLKPIFVDIEEDTFCIDPKKVEEVITEKTVAIVATHVYGFLCDVESLQKIADKYNLYLIFDAAHAFGVELNGIGSGNFGDISMFSTHATKVFHTIEGGIITYKSTLEDKLSGMKEIVNFGFRGQEDAVHVGTNARMNEFEAAMGICNLRHIDDEIKKRKKVAECYYKRLSNIEGVSIPKPQKGLKWNYAYFPVIFDPNIMSRDKVKDELEKNNIYARKYFYPLTTKVSVYFNEYGDQKFPVAEKIADRVLTLPLYSDMTEMEVNKVCDIILELLK